MAKNLLAEVAGMLRSVQSMLESAFAPKERAVSMPNVYQLVAVELQKQTEMDGIWRALIDVYLDGAEMYIVLAVDGLLYKSSLILSGGGVMLGEPMLVEVDYKPVTQMASGLRVQHQADGKWRWFAFPAATAVLNRSGELDTRALYQNFVKRIEAEEAPYPFLSFYHIGERITLGQADFAAVEDYAYLLSGTFADDPLAQAVRKSIEAEPGYWGTSIGFYYDSRDPKAKDKVEIADGITIPAYTDGINHEVSILPEAAAACLYTGIYVQEEGVNRMNQKVKDALKKIAGNDPEVLAIVDELEIHVDEINTDITDKDLIRRAGETVAEVPVDETTEAPIVEPVQEPVQDEVAETTILVEDAAMDALAERVWGRVNDEFNAQLVALQTDHETSVTALTAQVTQLAERIASLERTDGEKITQAVADMPRNQVRVGYRPTQRTAEQPEVEEVVTSEDIAQATLANLKR